ncbi:hypothetical protein CN575_21330 [Bacillus wiedmannii]|uniref:hypothetical protein n=1 Tax=Bacillus wiedmannii TaxID=1890302 RepID=UPI000BF70B0C|nr:hypothetical protein [Bacillus wiedmannii]PEP31644.1 hypothetical protein CN575_21330 [Bacillus wiedmannii]
MLQIRRIEFNDERIGMGYNSETGQAIGTALEGFTVTADPVAPGQAAQSSITIVNSHEELMKNLGMSFEGQGRYGLASASAKVQFSESSSYNSTSTFLVARCIVKNPFMRGENFQVKKPAQNLLDSNRFAEFNTAFGDSFIRGIQTGGEFYAVIRITSVSIQEQNSLSASLQAEFNGLAASGEFKAKFNISNKNSSTKSEYTAIMFQRAGNGTEISPTVEISEVLNRFKTFPQIALAKSAAYEIEVATYNTLPLPIPTPEEQENFLHALRDTRDKKLYYIQTKNDIEFAYRNPMFFEDLPENNVLLNAINAYTKLINAVMDHGNRLSRGEMKPPGLFDPSKLSTPISEPTPIQLKRITPNSAPTIRVPNLIGYGNCDLEFAIRCLSAGSVDACIAGTVFPDEDGDPTPIKISREAAEFILLSMSGQVKLTFNPPDADMCGEPLISNAQIPSAGTLIETGSEIILQFG